MTFLGKALLCPAADTKANKQKSCNANFSARYKACEEESDTKGKKYRPRCARRHFYRLSLCFFRSAIIHHKSPSDQVDDCKHDNPHRIHEVPIKGDHAKAFTLSRVNPAEQRKNKDRREEKQPDYYVGRVESHQ